MAVVKMKLSQYIEETYLKGSAPDLRTLKGQIDRGALPGCTELCGQNKFGRDRKRYYVWVDDRTLVATWPTAAIKPVNQAAAKVLTAMGATLAS